jgi:type VI secretion system protein ImpK
MVDDDDPFFDPDEEKTVIKPVPGGRKREPSPERRRQAAAPRSGPVELGAREGLNPLEQSATVLLNLLGQVRNTATHPNPDGLHQQIADEIMQFERKAQLKGVSPETIYIARYALCSIIDEFVMATPWGANSIWSKQSLLSRFHKETSGGEKFFRLLEKLEEDPARNIDLLELFYLCLALGFRGKYAVSADGINELERVRESLYRLIRRHRDDPEPALSPSWEGLDKQVKARTGLIPAWMAVSIVVLLLLGAFSLWRFSLGSAADPVHAEVVTLGREESLIPTHILAPEPLFQIVSPEPPRFSLREFLAPEIAAGQVSVNELPDRMIVSINGDGLFESGSERIKPEYQAVLTRIGEGVDQTTGRVRVLGHSDNVPMRRNSRFASNFELSQARAESVLAILHEEMRERVRTVAEGLGDTQPIADNATREGRAQNRRVEVVVMERAGGES